MTLSSLRRTIVGAALTVLISTSALAPATAATPAEITWSNEITNGATYLYGQVPAAPTCTAVDDQVVPPTCVVSGYSNLVGMHTLTATATSSDVITPTVTTATISYTVQATWTISKFAKPVKMDGVWNRAKAGSTIPFKFKIEGMANSERATAVADFSYQQVSCTDPAVVLGESKAVASTRMGFKLKSHMAKFHQNWKTAKAVKAAKTVKTNGKPVAATTCFRVTMTAADGQAISALFQLR